MSHDERFWTGFLGTGLSREPLGGVGVFWVKPTHPKKNSSPTFWLGKKSNLDLATPPDPPPSDVLERPYTAGGGGVPPLTPPSSLPLDPLPPLPPPLVMFEADSQSFASAPSVPRGFELHIFRPSFGGDLKGTIGGGRVRPNPPPPLCPFRPPPPPPPPLLILPCPLLNSYKRGLRGIQNRTAGYTRKMCGHTHRHQDRS